MSQTPEERATEVVHWIESGLACKHVAHGGFHDRVERVASAIRSAVEEEREACRVVWYCRGCGLIAWEQIRHGTGRAEDGGGEIECGPMEEVVPEGGE
jgi:hypothetical protein